MKRFVIIVLFCVVSSVLIPLTAFYIMNPMSKKINLKNEPSAGEIKVYFHNEEVSKNIGTEEYLFGVVAAEMPAEFEIEALKAQAVAARSYTYYRKNNPTDKHPDAVVCTDSTHCKAYITQSDLKEKWGDKYSSYSGKILEAVNSTKGEILTYNGEVAMTVFHSQAGGGRTENSKDVWGGDVPYLISVESHGEEQAPNFYSTVKIPFEEFKTKIAESIPEFEILTMSDIGQPTLNDGGSVNTVNIGNVQLKGSELRKIFGLRSSCFKIKNEDNHVVFEVTGYGHGVGMSQYGANTMAKEGYSYMEILQHYYTGTDLNIV